MFTSKQEKERRVIDLYSQGKTYRQIAEEARVSPNDIHAILKKKEVEENNNTVTNNQQQPCSSLSTKAYELLSQGKKPFQVAIALNIRQSEATKYCREYWRLRGLHKLNSIYKETNGKIWSFWKLYKQLVKQRGMGIEQVVNVIDTSVHRLPYMESLYIQAKNETQNMQNTRQHLLNDMNALEYKISL
jgi:predicted transcriptional regulator